MYCLRQLEIMRIGLFLACIRMIPLLRNVGRHFKIRLSQELRLLHASANVCWSTELQSVAADTSLSEATPPSTNCAVVDASKSLTSSGQNSVRIIARQLSGTVKSYNSRNRYGFIIRGDNGEDILVHAKDIISSKPNSAFHERSLLGGEEVQFDIEQTAKFGERAVNVTGPNGAPVKGNPLQQAVPLLNQFPYLQTPFEFNDPRRSRLGGRIIARNVKGTVTRYTIVHRYGFIRWVDTGEDVFVWHKDIAKPNPEHKMRSLEPGEEVQFHVCREPKDGNLKAVCVTGPDGKSVRGNVDAEGPLAQKLLLGQFVHRPKDGTMSSNDAAFKGLSDRGTDQSVLFEKII